MVQNTVKIFSLADIALLLLMSNTRVGHFGARPIKIYITPFLIPCKIEKSINKSQTKCYLEHFAHFLVLKSPIKTSLLHNARSLWFYK